MRFDENYSGQVVRMTTSDEWAFEHVILCVLLQLEMEPTNENMFILISISGHCQSRLAFKLLPSSTPFPRDIKQNH